jgi:uncharacterized protein
LGDKTFVQCAGFMRIMEYNQPLDRSCVHPEAYPVVEGILAHTQVDISKPIGNSHHLGEIGASEFTDKKFGEVTVAEIIGELKKPGRDPRPKFKTALFKDGVGRISDLSIGMILEGIVTNVAYFEAFVGVGVHQGGLFKFYN